MTDERGPLIYIIAGEPSGDLLGARLMVALQEITGGKIRFAGIGGEAMAEQGLQTLFPLSDIAVMGLLEVLPKAPLILRRVRETVADIQTKSPNAIVTIDSWGFTGRIAKALSKKDVLIPRLHYVAPMVWAWRKGRAKHMRGHIDYLMCLLPHEPRLFAEYGITASHVGHAVMESGADRGDRAAFRHRYGFDDRQPLLCLLPGSRSSEVSRLLPVFEQTALLLKQRFPTLSIIMPTVATVEARVREAVADWAVPVSVVMGMKERYDAFAAADVALAASGSVALELALAKVPSVTTYKVSPLSAFLARHLVKVKYFNLVNLMTNRMVVPELMQDRCRPDILADEVTLLLTDPSKVAVQIEGLSEALQALGYGYDRPSHRAADIVLTYIDMQKRG